MCASGHYLARRSSTFLKPAGTSNFEASTGAAEKPDSSLTISISEPGAACCPCCCACACCCCCCCCCGGGSWVFLRPSPPNLPSRPPNAPPSAPPTEGACCCCC